jgi:hypothetical protein
VMPRVPARHEFRIRSSQIQGVRPELEPRLPIRARSPSLRATTRKPSCLISCSHSQPEGGFGTFIGRQGSEPGWQGTRTRQHAVLNRTSNRDGKAVLLARPATFRLRVT